MEYPALAELIKTISILRSENGCSWDREQTHASLRHNMAEEAYEAIDAINSGDMNHLKEELGDVLLQVVLHAQIAKEEGYFDIEDVAKRLNDKQLRECIMSEFKEFDEAKTYDEKEEEFGDILFAVVNLARRNQIDAEQALIRSNTKFMKRFRTMEELAKKPLTELTFEEWDALWKKAKKSVSDDVAIDVKAD